MIPLRDHNPSETTPYLTYLLILVNVLVFLYMLTQGFEELSGFIMNYSVKPIEIMHGRGLYTLVTSMFLHGGLWHLLGNMVFLHVFGDNLEDRLGRFRFLVFYFLCGIIASLAQIAMEPASQIPLLGASGAIAGVMGGYIHLFPRRKIDVLFIFGFFITTYQVSAYFMLFYWIAYQVILGVISIPAAGSGGVAYFAHIGGFLAGYILIRLSGVKKRG